MSLLLHPNSTAVFVDLENLRLAVFERAYKKEKLFFDYTETPEQVINFCNECVFDTHKESELQQLYRIFFYTASPLLDHVKRKKILDFLQALEKANHAALRLGKLVKRGDEIVQKQVDMLLGLDMAEVAIKRFVKKVILIGYDSDMSPALKLARMNGIQTGIVVFEDLPALNTDNLAKHCDFIKKVQVRTIYERIGVHTSSKA